MDTIGGREVSLGDLTDLTITNDDNLSCDLSDGKDAFRKMWNPKFIFYSCWGRFCSLAFHHSHLVLLTASGGPRMLWNLTRPSQTRTLCSTWNLAMPSRLTGAHVGSSHGHEQ